MNHRIRKRILLADNLPEYRRSVIGFLELDGYEVTEAGSPEEALEKLEQDFDLVLVDIRLRDDDDPNDLSGLEIAKFASERDIPSIIVTAFPTVQIARTALRTLGAEPYAQDMITKGTDPQAVLDSISHTLASIDTKPKKPTSGGLLLDQDRQLVWKDGELLHLPNYQYLLLEALFKKDGGLCTYTELILAIYDEQMMGKPAQNNKRLRNLVERTKDRIEEKGSGFEYIESVPGRGYRLNLKK